MLGILHGLGLAIFRRVGLAQETMDLEVHYQA